MKYISRILFTVGLVFGLTACTEDAYETTAPELPAKGDMSVNITFAMSDAAAQTRSMVSGTETPVTVMQMVCFDAKGLYLGIRNAIVTNDDPTATGFYDSGVIKGTVPEGTSRIHFIANRDLSIPLSFTVGTPEETVMISPELSTKFDDADHQKVCYWGYHKEGSADAMKAWLNPTAAHDPVYMIRDRAKIEFRYNDTNASVPVTKIEWLIHNGRDRGYLAPDKKHWGDGTTQYWGNSTQSDHESDIISSAGMNEYKTSGRYSLWTSEDENEDENFDVAYQSGTTTSQPQFLFDDDNTDIDDLKVIIRVTYTVNSKPETVYHVIKLNKEKSEGSDVKELYDIVRNNTYYIKSKNLDPTIASYKTLKEAIDGTEYMNAEFEVDRTIAEISNNQYTLQIKLPNETTSIVLNTEGDHTMDFVFRMAADVSQPGSTDPNDFKVYWEKSQTFCENTLGLVYNSALKQFKITATVKEGQLSERLQDQWIVVEHKASGLKRFIHVFVIDQFRYKLYPTLTKVGDDYKLSFQLPPMEHTQFLPDGSGNPEELIYPESLYPIDVKFTTNTLNAYGISQGVTNYGLFGVATESTAGLVTVENFEDGYNAPVSITVDNDENKKLWYFQQGGNFWDFWYVYSLKTYPTDGMVNIYFKDVRDHITYATVSDVGLFLYVEYFGKNYSIPLSTN